MARVFKTKRPDPSERVQSAIPRQKHLISGSSKVGETLLLDAVMPMHGFLNGLVVQNLLETAMSLVLTLRAGTMTTTIQLKAKPGVVEFPQTISVHQGDLVQVEFESSERPVVGIYVSVLLTEA